MLIFKGVIIAILAFLLGVTFTLFCMGLSKRRKEVDRDDA